MTGISIHLHHAVQIQRKHPLDQWHVALHGVPDEAKAECRAYLPIMAERTRLAERLKVLRRLQESAPGKII